MGKPIVSIEKTTKRGDWQLTLEFESGRIFRHYLKTSEVEAIRRKSSFEFGRKFGIDCANEKWCMKHPRNWKRLR